MKTFVIAPTTTLTTIQNLINTAGYTYNPTDFIQRKKCYIYCTSQDIQLQGTNETGTVTVPLIANQWLILDDNTTNIGLVKIRVASGTPTVNILLY
jgi:hypothetical protein